MLNAIIFVAVIIVTLIITLLSLWAADKVAHAAATKMSENKSDTSVTIRRWSFWGVTTTQTTSKQIWYGVVYNVTLNVVFRLVSWALANALTTGTNVIKRQQVGVY